MELKINSRLPKKDDIEGVPVDFLIPSQSNSLEQLNLDFRESPCVLYQERIRECFAQAYRFLDEHKHARTDSDCKRIAVDLGQYSDPLTMDLIVACVNELEREYKEHEKGHIG